MIEINVHSDIAKEEPWFALWGEENMVFSLETVKRIFESNKDETEFQFNYHCDGGSVSEGFAIYDYIRTSGKIIHSNIEGDCHSMAITLMLAGEKSRRRCNPNASALIHEVRGGVSGTADEIREYAEYMDQQTQKMLDIYVDRTGTDRETLEALLKEEKVRTADELLQYGFISKINPYTTNQMAKKTKEEIEALINKGTTFLGALKNFLAPQKPAEEPKTFNFLDKDGATLFTVNREDDRIEVDDTASPDGVYDFEDGRKVTVTDGKIASIEEKPVEPVNAQEIEELTTQVQELTNQVQQLTEKLTEAQNIISEQNEAITSNYVPAQRTVVAKSAKNEKDPKTAEQLKQEVKDKLATRKTN